MLTALALLALPAVAIIAYLAGKRVGIRAEQRRTCRYIEETYQRIMQSYFHDEVTYPVDGRRGVEVSSRVRGSRN